MTNATATKPAKSADGEKVEKDTATIAMQVPPEFKALLEERAKADSVTVAKFVRSEMAKIVTFDLTTFEQKVRTRSSKFASDDERKAAAKEASQKRQAVIKALMEKYKKGEVTLDA